MTKFGEQLRKFRQQCHDPVSRQGKLTQKRLGELLQEEVGVRYSGVAVSDWERGKSRIDVDDRPILGALIKILYKYGGLKSIEEADRFLEVGNYRALDVQEKQKIFQVTGDDTPDGHVSSEDETSKPFILLKRFFSISDEELREHIDYTQKGPPPSWPRLLTVFMRKGSERWSISISSVFWMVAWALAWWLVPPSLRWPFADQTSAFSAIVMYAGGTLAVPLLIGSLVTTKESDYWKQQSLANSKLLRLYTYQGAAIGFNLGYFFVFPFILVWYYLNLGPSVWLEITAVTLGLILGNVGARVVPHNLWLAYGRLHLSDCAIFFVVALLGPLWGFFFLQYYSVLLTPLFGSIVILIATALLIMVAARQSKKADAKQAQP